MPWPRDTVAAEIRPGGQVSKQQSGCPPGRYGYLAQPRQRTGGVERVRLGHTAGWGGDAPSDSFWFSSGSELSVRIVSEQSPHADNMLLRFS
ncbi:hypothetical protein DPEC_G00360450 [Dallia pectoralis]|uniref:Uncharacterized protein n=1 Tax=Dallia pectoralis TaxID=75939 RepID=A0ACC2F0X4_DALPE|nr:hypothetical protein DPEC_G00360450 [Dallia pectoralis]